MYQVWQSATLDELPKLFDRVKLYKNTTSETWTTYSTATMSKNLLLGYVDQHKDEIKNAIDWMATQREKKQYLKNLLSWVWLDTSSMRKAIAGRVWADY
jgi:hypothetical protein